MHSRTPSPKNSRRRSLDLVLRGRTPVGHSTIVLSCVRFPIAVALYSCEQCSFVEFKIIDSARTP